MIRLKPQHLHEILAGSLRVVLENQVIESGTQPGLRIQRAQGNETVGDLRGGIELSKLMVLRGQKIEAGSIAGIGGDFLVENADVPVVSLTPRLRLTSEFMVDADVSRHKPPASR